MPDDVELVEVGPDNIRRVAAIAPYRSQQRFVATVAESLADALVPEVADGAHPVPYLWRLVIDRHHQSRGIGRRVIELAVDHVRTAGATELSTTWVEGRGGPARFSERLGFVATGEIVDGEIVATVALSG